jgi:sugar phosphate permease
VFPQRAVADEKPLPSAARAGLKDSPQRWLLVALMHVGMFSCYVQRGALSVAAPFLIAELGLSTAVMGVLLSAFFWPYAFMQTPAGWAVDRYGVKRVYAWGFAVWSLAAAATGLARGLLALALLRACLGAGQSAIFPAHARAVANWFAERERGMAMAFANAGTRLGQGVVNGFGPPLIVALGWPFFFGVTGLLPLVWLPAWLIFMKPWEDPKSGGDASQGRAASLPESFALLRQRSVLGICLGYFGYNYAWIVLYTWLPGYLKLERGFGTREMAFFGSIPYVAGFAVALVTGVMSDWCVRRGYRELVVRKFFMTAGMAGGCLVVPAGLVADKMTAVWLFVAALCSLSVSGVSSWVVTQAVCDKRIVGTACGLQNFFGNLPGIIAPALTGLIAHATGSFALAMGLTGALLVGGILSYWLLVGESVELPQRTPEENLAQGE